MYVCMHLTNRSSGRIQRLRRRGGRNRSGLGVRGSSCDAVIVVVSLGDSHEDYKELAVVVWAVEHFFGHLGGDYAADAIYG